MLRLGLLLGGILATVVLFGQQTILKQGDSYYNEFLFKEAIPKYEEALAKDPHLAEAMLQLGLSYFYTNQPEKAIVWLERVNKIDGFQKYAMEYGRVLRMLGRYREAQVAFRMYRKFDTTASSQYMKSCLFALNSGMNSNNIFQVKPVSHLNSRNADFAPMISGTELLFASARSVAIKQGGGKVVWTNDAFNQVYKSSLNKDTPSKPRPLRKTVGKEINNAPLSLSSQENLVAITSNNFMDGIRHIKGAGLMMDIYLYKTAGDGTTWEHNSQEFFPFNATVDANVPYSTGHPCFSPKTKALYFTSDCAGGMGGYDIYVSYKTSTGWTKPANLGYPINTPGNEMCPFVDLNGRLYFASDWHEGFGGMDLFSAKKVNNVWGDVLNLGLGVNSSYDDMYFTFETTSREGFFSSNRPGGKGNEDIYMVKQVQSYPAEKHYSLAVGDRFEFGDVFYAPTSSALKNTNNEVFYTFVRKLLANPALIVEINAHTDSRGLMQSNQILSEARAKAMKNYLIAAGVNRNRIRTNAFGERRLRNHCKNRVSCSDDEHSVNRRVEVYIIGEILSTGIVNINSKVSPYSGTAKPIVIREKVSNTSIRKQTRATRYSSSHSHATAKAHYAVGDKIEVANIKYERSKATIDYKRSKGLKHLLNVLKTQPHVVIEIGAHTDASGSDKFNLELSQKRAKNVVSYLVKNGISKSRLIAKGYGESKLLNRCKNGVRCSDEAHAENRRTEFKVVAQKGFRVGDIIKVEGIFYDFGKSTLDFKRSNGLKEAVELLKKTEISVEIRSHTDARGSSKYNAELSDKRAKAIYDYLVKNGVNRFRLKYKGYGEAKLLNKCKDGVRCSDDQHQENRRTDFKVIGLK